MGLNKRIFKFSKYAKSSILQIHFSVSDTSRTKSETPTFYPFLIYSRSSHRRYSVIKGSLDFAKLIVKYLC